MKAIWNDSIIAESDVTVVVEGNHYFPLDAVNQSFLKPSDKTTYCSWKGTANYYSLVVNDKDVDVFLDDVVTSGTGINPYRFTHFTNIDAWTEAFTMAAAAALMSAGSPKVEDSGYAPEGLMQFVRSLPDTSASSVCRELIRWTGATVDPPEDDISLLILRLTG